MLNTRRTGFTIVELLVVIVVGGIILGSVVQTLIMQERTYRTTGEMVRGQDALRIAVGVLEAELREIATQGPTIGVNDIVYASRDSVTFRAQRKLAFVCGKANNDRRIFTWSPSQTDWFNPAESSTEFTQYDGVFVFHDGNIASAADDGWIAARVTNVQNSSVACPGKPGTQEADNRLDLQTIGGGTIDISLMEGIHPGAPVRSFQQVTYGLYERNGDWVLARRRGVGPLETLVAGLAGQNVGLRFTYLDANGNTIAANPAPANQVAAIRIRAQTNPPAGTGANAVTQTTTIFLRNN